METGAAGTIDVQGVTQIHESNGQRTHALDDISFALPAGGFVSLVGPSGCGKSSLLMILAGLATPTSGSLMVAGAPILRPDPSRIGVVFQDANLFPWLTARKNVEFPLTLQGVRAAERQ